ncbi:odorant receptor Or2-like [Schistocerca gregaria]|uniref:odorant receptor Or2-like n=1 Tax=Schistocerca gregaria TaxID=7010 RepID=UPI00211DC4FB|nr:odorant receptor Or2-like [Schistocerca gregaria]
MEKIPATEAVGPQLGVELRLQLAVLRAVSAWAPDGWPALRRVYHAYTGGVVALLAALVAAQGMAARHFWGDMLSVTMNACVIFTYLAAALKAVAFVTMRHFADTLVHDINRGLQEFGEAYRQEKEAVYAACARQSVLLTCVHVGMGAVVNACWLTMPATKVAACQTIECRIKEGLPAPVWFPFPFTEPPVYEAVYVGVSLALFYGYILTTMLDGFFFTLIIYTAGQLRVLNLMATRLCDPEPGSKVCLDEQLQWRIAEVVQCHTHIDRCVQRLSTLLGPILLGQFLSDILTVSITAFVVTAAKTDSEWLFKYGSYLSAISEQLLLYCWLGHDILTESERLQMSAYSSDWTAAPRRLRAQLRVFLCRAHRPLRLTASKFYTISRDTFLLLMNASFSYYAVLRQLNGD